MSGHLLTRVGIGLPGLFAILPYGFVARLGNALATGGRSCQAC